MDDPQIDDIPTSDPSELIEAPAVASGEIQSGRLAGKSLGAAITILAFPVLLQQVMAAFVGLVDKMLAGNLPEDIVIPALDGVGVGSYVGWLIGIAMSGLGIGGQAIIARSMGSGDIAQGERALGQALSLSIAWGVLCGVVMWLLSDYLAEIGGLGEQATVFCNQYVRTFAVSMPFFGVIIVGAMCMQGGGDTLKPFFIAVVVNIVNVIASWILSGADVRFGDQVIVNPFSFDLDVLGIVLGSLFSIIVGAVLTMMVLFRGIKDLRLQPKLMSLHPNMAWRVVRIGIPNFFEGLAMWAANIIVLGFIGMIAGRAMQAAITSKTGEGSTNLAMAGEGLQGAHIIAVQWEAFSFLPGFAIGIAAGALAGQYLGAGNVAMARKAVWVCVAIGVILMGLIGLVFVFWGRELTAVISTQEMHLNVVPKLLLICGVTQVFFAASMVIRQALRGTGDTIWVFIITVVSSYGIRLPAAWFLGVYLEWGLPGIWIGLCGELGLRAMMFLWRFIHGGWAQRTL
ncbi:MAG: MATE family efflux transporter [Planctomycetota bacterium]|nr:MATE family efflux transporter [Planctomycetota bacterium]